jgi:hypothetical protein
VLSTANILPPSSNVAVGYAIFHHIIFTRCLKKKIVFGAKAHEATRVAAAMRELLDKTPLTSIVEQQQDIVLLEHNQTVCDALKVQSPARTVPAGLSRKATYDPGSLAAPLGRNLLT